MEHATIITLGKGTNIDGTSSTFEEAFGEFSEARGRGRARKKNRRLERIKNRAEVRAARRKARRDAMEERLEKRKVRKTSKSERKAIGSEEEELEEPTQVSPNDAPAPEDEGTSEGPPTDEGNTGGQTGGGQTGGSGGEEEWGGGRPTGSGGSSDEWGGGAPTGSGGSSDEWGGGAPQQQEETGPYANDNEEDEEEGDNFDGVMGGEDDYNEFSDSDGVRVSPAVSDISKKIEWNKELVSRLGVEKAVLEGKNADTTDIVKQIQNRNFRIKQLQRKLSKYVNFEGEFSLASGERPTQGVMRRKREVGKASKSAARNRSNMHKRRDSANYVKYQEGMSRKNNDGGDATPVSNELNPKFNRNRIVVPGKSKSSADGDYLANDIDAPNTRFVELGSNLEGDKTKINWKGIAIGVAVGVLAIWAIKKYKILGK